MSVGHAHQMTLVLPAFTSLQDSDEKLCGFLDWLLDAIEVYNDSPKQKSIIAPSQHVVSNCTVGARNPSAQLCGELPDGHRRAGVMGGIHLGFRRKSGFTQMASV